MGKLSVIIPVYNERPTLEALVARVRAVDYGMPLELVLVDDCSSDGSRELVEKLAATHPGIVAAHQEPNRGKGAALRRGFEHATGDYRAHPGRGPRVRPARDPEAARADPRRAAPTSCSAAASCGGPHRVLYFWHSIGNKLLTTLSNMFTNLNLTDMETCYKVFRREVIAALRRSARTASASSPRSPPRSRVRGARIYEVPISYSGRTYDEGKKIGWRDGVRALRCVLWYNLFAR